MALLAARVGNRARPLFVVTAFMRSPGWQDPMNRVTTNNVPIGRGATFPIGPIYREPEKTESENQPSVADGEPRLLRFRFAHDESPIMARGEEVAIPGLTVAAGPVYEEPVDTRGAPEAE